MPSCCLYLSACYVYSVVGWCHHAVCICLHAMCTVWWDGAILLSVFVCMLCVQCGGMVPSCCLYLSACYVYSVVGSCHLEVGGQLLARMLRVQVLCRLQHWDECVEEFVPYASFELHEDSGNVVHLPQLQPANIPSLAVARVWRVVLCPPTHPSPRSPDLPSVSATNTRFGKASYTLSYCPAPR